MTILKYFYFDCSYLIKNSIQLLFSSIFKNMLSCKDIIILVISI